MQELDKTAMGKRIRQIRLGANLRQWELAKLLGTTQSAVHKYEHGVVPEPRRLVELARIGGTSIEWVLTGQHWENGSRDQPRLASEVLQTAWMLRAISEQERATVDEALQIMRQAVAAIDTAELHMEAATDYKSVTASLREHGGETLRLLERASRIQRAVLRQLAQEAERRLEPRSAPTELGSFGEGPAASRPRS